MTQPAAPNTAAPNTTKGPPDKAPAKSGDDGLLRAMADVTDNGLAHLRRVDPDAASDIDAVRRREDEHPIVVIVGETKRGKSSLVNALLGAPGLSPVDAAVATSAYLEFRYDHQTSARAYVPGDDAPMPLDINSLRDWGTVLGSLPDNVRPPRRIEVRHPAPLLQRIDLVDTPGVGGLDSAHAEIALDAVEHATALLFVVDASAPFSQPELDFLVEASKRVNMVLFALTKIDVYPGWRTVLDDNKSQLKAHAPRFGNAGFFPVSSSLAEMAGTLPADAGAAVLAESRIEPLRSALLSDIAARGELLQKANVLRTVRSELIRLDQMAGEKIRNADPDPATLQQLKDERAAVAAKKRKETRSWQLSMSTEIKRARTDIMSRVRTEVSKMQEAWLNSLEKANGDQIKRLPYDVDKSLHALALRLSTDLGHRFRTIGHRMLQQVFTASEMNRVLSRLNSRLSARIETKPQRSGGGPDGLLVVTSTAGTAMMAGRAAMAGAGALALGVAAVPVGIGLGLAAGAFLLYRRKVSTNRQQAKVWLKEVLGEARGSLNDTISFQFTDLEHTLTVALQEAIDRRIEELDSQITDIDKAFAEDKSTRQKKQSELRGERDQLRNRLGPIDDVLVKVRRATAINGETPKPSKPAG